MEEVKQIFEGKTLTDLAKEVYDKHKEQDTNIKQRVEQLSEMIESPGDAIVLVPMIKGYLDSSLKNDEVLLKLLHLFQKQEDKKALANDANNGILTDKDIEQLFDEVSSYTVSAPKVNQITEGDHKDGE